MARNPKDSTSALRPDRKIKQEYAYIGPSGSLTLANGNGPYHQGDWIKLTTSEKAVLAMQGHHFIPWADHQRAIDEARAQREAETQHEAQAQHEHEHEHATKWREPAPVDTPASGESQHGSNDAGAVDEPSSEGVGQLPNIPLTDSHARHEG